MHKCRYQREVNLRVKNETFYPTCHILSASMSFWSYWCQSAIERWTKNTVNCFTGKRSSHIDHSSPTSSRGCMMDMQLFSSLYKCWKQWAFFAVNSKYPITRPEELVFLLSPVLCSDLPWYNFHAELEGARLPCLAVQGWHSAPDVLTYVFIHGFISTTVCLSATTWPSVAYGNWFSDFCKQYFSS